MPDPADAPKIIVDSDWKSQAQAEKERLAAKEESLPRAGAPEGMPPADFRTLMSMIATNALVYMGAFPDPETGRAIVALDYARHYIDLLDVLAEKTKGNLNEEETADIAEVLNELRMRYVQLTGAVEKARRQPPEPPHASGGVGGVTT